MKKYLEIEFENCEIVKLETKGIFLRFEVSDINFSFGRKSIGIKNAIMTIPKDLEGKTQWGSEWKERIKSPDITHFYWEKECYYVDDWSDDDFSNKYQEFSENDKEIRIVISKDKKFRNKYKIKH